MNRSNELHARIRQLEEENKRKESENRRLIEQAAQDEAEKQLLIQQATQAEAEKQLLIQQNEAMIEGICLQSPWQFLQFPHGDIDGKSASSNKSVSSAQSSSSSSGLRSPQMNKQRRKKFRVKVSRTCQITKCTASEILKIAHIVPRKTAAQSLREWGVEPNSDKNMLLLVSALEDSFDKGHFCLLLKSVPGTGEEALAVKILNKSIKDVPIQGTELKFKTSKIAFWMSAEMFLRIDASRNTAITRLPLP